MSYQTLRNWKAADKWEEALPKKKRGGQPGNQNSKGKRNAAGSHDGAPPGNKNAEKDGAYSTVFFDIRAELHGSKGGVEAAEAFTAVPSASGQDRCGTMP